MGARILVVEDNPVNQVIYNEILADHFEIQVAGSGAEALEIISDFKPQIIVLDVMMPGMDGYEVCRRVRADGQFEDCRIIMVSARAMEEEKNMGLEAGADAYITKPFDEEELLDKIMYYLS